MDVGRQLTLKILQWQQPTLDMSVILETIMLARNQKLTLKLGLPNEDEKLDVLMNRMIEDTTEDYIQTHQMRFPII
jgi:hypothetical protein